jgi:hypothetical protein
VPTLAFVANAAATVSSYRLTLHKTDEGNFLEQQLDEDPDARTTIVGVGSVHISPYCCFVGWVLVDVESDVERNIA